VLELMTGERTEQVALSDMGLDTSTPADLELAPDSREGFDLDESSAIAAEARQGRVRDRELVRGLEHRQATTTELSSGYMFELGRRATLPRATEQKLVRQAVAGNAQARAELVEAFLPLIGSVARNYRTSAQISRVELMQEGVVGLLRGLERYNPDLGIPFWAYAAWWVRQAMQQLVSELARPVVLSDHALRQLARLKEAHRDIQRHTGQEPTLSQLAERTGLHHDQLANLIAVDRPPRALEEPLEGSEGAVGTFGELLADPLAEDEYERVVSHIAAGQLRDLLSGLSERERDVLRARFGLDGQARNLREIAENLGVSSERVRQIENRALGKLRAAAVGSAPTAS
jgi:RNA polymerase sigma factor (sigma-70 family)